MKALNAVYLSRVKKKLNQVLAAGKRSALLASGKRTVLALRLQFHPALLKAFFLSRVLREKILLLGLVLIVSGTWFTSVVRRTGRFGREFGVTSDLLTSQRGWLGQRAAVEAEAKAAVEHLDPSKTFDGVRLQAEIDALLRRTGVTNYSADSVQTERTSQFSKHTMQLQIRNADYGILVKFYLELSKQAPYIGIQQFALSANNGKHSAALKVFSVETPK